MRAHRYSMEGQGSTIHSLAVLIFGVICFRKFQIGSTKANNQQHNKKQKEQYAEL